jgi:hypothetical protein
MSSSIDRSISRSKVYRLLLQQMEDGTEALRYLRKESGPKAHIHRIPGISARPTLRLYPRPVNSTSLTLPHFTSYTPLPDPCRAMNADTERPVASESSRGHHDASPDGSPAASKRRRVALACSSCRNRKTKVCHCRALLYLHTLKQRLSCLLVRWSTTEMYTVCSL